MWTLVLICLTVAATIYSKWIKIHRIQRTKLKSEPTKNPCLNAWNYDVMKKLIHEHNIRLPAMFVDLDVFDHNTKLLVDMVRNSGKNLRIATKSVRCPFLIKRINNLGKDVVKGFMCYSVQEVILLADEGLGDFFIPYPTLQRCDILPTLDLLNKGVNVTLTIDSVENVMHLDQITKEEQAKVDVELPKIRVCVDLDLSYKALGGLIHLGAHRSQVDSVSKFAAIVSAVKQSNYLELVGVMGYEAQVAGLPDKNPFSPFPNLLIQFLKGVFYKNAVRLRLDVHKFCLREGIHLDFFNGGGSGNIQEACRDDCITEVTAGSAFLQAQLFDYFVDNQCSAALVFALQATRSNEKYIVCQSGGFVASGSINGDKSPIPYKNPLHLKPYSDEGFGEVQTPLRIVACNSRVPGIIGLSDPVLFRPAKSGEIGEHFREYHLLQCNELVGTVKTYRGLGHAFY